MKATQASEVATIRETRARSGRRLYSISVRGHADTVHAARLVKWDHSCPEEAIRAAIKAGFKVVRMNGKVVYRG